MVRRRPRDVVLKVAEVEQMSALLNAAMTAAHLEGVVRQQVTEARELLVEIIGRGVDGQVVVSTDEIVVVLRCAMSTQSWLAKSVTDLLIEKTND
jgi:hypothetical protein